MSQPENASFSLLSDSPGLAAEMFIANENPQFSRTFVAKLGKEKRRRQTDKPTHSKYIHDLKITFSILYSTFFVFLNKFDVAIFPVPLSSNLARKCPSTVLYSMYRRVQQWAL